MLPSISTRRARRRGETPARTRSLAEIAHAADAKHPDFADHPVRVAELACRLATEASWPKDAVAALHEAALLHDLGTIAVPDAIVGKAGELTPGERAQVQTHAAAGAEMLKSTLSDQQVAWVRRHHERWDGNGYPDGLAGPAVPDGARLLALADAFDAMTHQRPYREALTHELALLEIHAHSDTQFDPRAVELLERILPRTARIDH